MSASRSEGPGSRGTGALAILLVALLAASCDGTSGALFTPSAAGRVDRPELILFGPRTFQGADELQQLVAAADVVDQAPFEGMVLDVGFDADWWGRDLDRAAFDESVAVLARAPFGRLKANFQRVTLSSVGTAWDPFDDALFARAAANARVTGQLVKDAGLRGIFLDTQSYGSPMWVYPGGAAARPFAEYEEKVKQRGYELMSALVEGDPAATVLLSFAYAEAFRETCIEGTPLEATRYALLPAFLDGMFKARADARASAPIIDAFLPSYPAKAPASFQLFYDLIHFDWPSVMAHWFPGVISYLFLSGTDPGIGLQQWPDRPVMSCTDADRAKVARDVPAAFGLAIAYDSWSRGGFHTSPGELDQNYYTPRQFSDVLGAALRATDRYVWIWSASVTWWPPAGPDEVMVPQPYLDAVRAVHP